MTAVLYLQLASQGKIKWLKKWLAGTGSAVVYRKNVATHCYEATCELLCTFYA
jgi:hypothetical protein